MRPVARILFLSFLSILVIYLLVFQIQAIWRFTIDDMYITLRYAKHWGSNGALLWNVGEMPVEGYSNFSFLLIARFFELLQMDPVFGLKMVGVASLLGLSVGVFVLTKHVAGIKYAVIPVIWLLVYRGQVIWAVSGLETTFYQCTLIFAVYHLLKASEDQTNRDASLAGFLFALLGLTRPEGGLLALCYFLVFGVCAFHQPNFKLRCYYLIGFFAIVYFPYFSWRWFYFGYLFPNSVYCKAVSTEFMGALDARYLKLAWPFLCCALFLLKKSVYRRICLFFILPSLFYLIFCWTADPVVAFDNRLFLPALALLFSLATLGLSRAVQQSFLVYALSIALLCCAIPKISLEGYRHFTTNPTAGERLRREVSHWLSTHAHPKQNIVLADSGLIPYLNPELNFIDSYCLNNLEMGHAPTEQRYTDFCQNLLDEHPSYIILTAWIHDGYTEYTPADVCLKAALSETKQYQLLNVFRSYNPDHTTYQYMLFGLNSLS